jgi:hypothetical protein
VSWSPSMAYSKRDSDLNGRGRVILPRESVLRMFISAMGMHLVRVLIDFTADNKPICDKYQQRAICNFVFLLRRRWFR